MHTLILAALLAQAQPASIEVKLADGAGNPVGTATLTQTAHGVLIAADLHDMKPGKHAIHLHETGKCEGPAFKSAGGHFNPAKKQHGFMTAEGPHAGDLPNIDVGPEGKARAELIAGDASLDALQANGAALVLHAKADDYNTQPAGDAGDRVACGVIQEQ